MCPNIAGWQTTMKYPILKDTNTGLTTPGRYQLSYKITH